MSVYVLFKRVWVSVTKLRLVLFANAPLPMEVTEEGIVTDVKPLFRYASGLIEVTEEEITRALLIILSSAVLMVVTVEPSGVGVVVITEFRVIGLPA